MHPPPAEALLQCAEIAAVKRITPSLTPKCRTHLKNERQCR